MTSERNPERDLMNQKKKNEKSVPFETKFLTIENVENMSSITQWKKCATLIVRDAVLAGVEEKHSRK